MIKKILNFLFGSKPNIFNAKGRVQHQLDNSVWQNWSNQYKDDTHNWKNHSGNN